MDFIFIGLACSCLLLSAEKFRNVFLCLVVAEFMVSAVWILFPAPDPWWFLSYAAQNCIFAWLIMRTRHAMAREYAGTLIASAAIAVIVFCESFTGGNAAYAARPNLMTWICVCQLCIAAAGAGLMEWTPLEAARGIVARCRRGRRRAGADHPSGTVDRGV